MQNTTRASILLVRVVFIVKDHIPYFQNIYASTHRYATKTNKIRASILLARVFSTVK